MNVDEIKGVRIMLTLEDVKEIRANLKDGVTYGRIKTYWGLTDEETFAFEKFISGHLTDEEMTERLSNLKSGMKSREIEEVMK